MKRKSRYSKRVNKLFKMKQHLLEKLNNPKYKKNLAENYKKLYMIQTELESRT